MHEQHTSKSTYKRNASLPRLNTGNTKKRPKMRWSILFIIVFIAVLSALVTNFFDRLHYDNLLNLAYQQSGTLYRQRNQQQQDLKYVIHALTTPLNCYQLQSSYSQNLCHQHNNIITQQNSTP